MVDQLNGSPPRSAVFAREVGTKASSAARPKCPESRGTWKDLTDNVNANGLDLTGQVRNIAEVTTAVARGDSLSKITVDGRARSWS